MSEWLPEAVAVGIAVPLCLLYRQAARHARAQRRPLPADMRGRVAVFVGGVLAFVAAFVFLAHSVLAQMFEHILLAFAVPPLLLLGVPRPLLLPLFERRLTRRVMRSLTRPTRAAMLFLVVLFLWYMPGAFNATLASAAIRLAAGLSITAVAVLFWWPLIEPFPAWERELADLGKLLYLFAGSTALKVLGFILAIAPRPIYALPATGHPLWGLTPLTDQEYAGWLMVAAGTLVLLAAATVVCIRLFHDPDEPGSVETGEPGSRRAREIPGPGDEGAGR
jgi:cytochrome c oxidase assembly factor CtaG